MKKKPLEQMLIEHAARLDPGEAAKKFVVFLEHWKEVQTAYKSGWSYASIWRVLREEGVLDFSYSSFMHFVQKMRDRQRLAEGGKVVPAKAAKKAEPSPPATGWGAPPAPIAPGSTRVDMPVFGKKDRPNDPNRF